MGILTPRVDVTWQSTIHFSATELTDPLANQPSYGLVNARLTWRPIDGKWTLSGAVTNLGNKLYYTQKFDGLTSFGTATGQVGMPREFTVSIRRSF
jgi:iron complex outermembrane receptor protein